MAVTAQPRHKWNSKFYGVVPAGATLLRADSAQPEAETKLEHRRARLSFTGDET